MGKRKKPEPDPYRSKFLMEIYTAVLRRRKALRNLGYIWPTDNDLIDENGQETIWFETDEVRPNPSARIAIGADRSFYVGIWNTDDWEWTLELKADRIVSNHKIILTLIEHAAFARHFNLKHHDDLRNPPLEAFNKLKIAKVVR